MEIDSSAVIALEPKRRNVGTAAADSDNAARVLLAGEVGSTLAQRGMATTRDAATQRQVAEEALSGAGTLRAGLRRRSTSTAR
jgi:hypothetical protein